jgi:hypothetical protein
MQSGDVLERPLHRARRRRQSLSTIISALLTPMFPQGYLCTSPDAFAGTAVAANFGLAILTGGNIGVIRHRICQDSPRLVSHDCHNPT